MTPAAGVRRGVPHALQALRAIVLREVLKFSQQTGRLVSALVRPLLWLAVFAAGFRNVFGVAIVEPYDTYIPYDVYIAPGLVGMVLLFNGMQSSLAMVYDREMGSMRLLLTSPLPRWWLLASKLIAGAAISVLQAYAFLAIAALYGIRMRRGRQIVGWSRTPLRIRVVRRMPSNFQGTLHISKRHAILSIAATTLNDPIID